MDRLLSPYLRFLGTRYRRVVIWVVQHGPEGAHDTMIETLDEELDEIDHQGNAVGGRLTALRDRIVRCHRENASFYRLVCERATEVWPNEAADVASIIALLPEPPEPIRAAYENRPVSDPTEFERFRFLRGAKDIKVSSFETVLLDKRWKKRKAWLFNIVGRTPKSLVPNLVAAVGREFRKTGILFRPRDLASFTLDDLRLLSTGVFTTLPGTSRFAACLERFRCGELVPSDAKLLASIARTPRGTWELLARTRRTSRKRTFHLLTGRPASDFYRSLAGQLQDGERGTTGESFFRLCPADELEPIIRALVGMQRAGQVRDARLIGEAVARLPGADVRRVTTNALRGMDRRSKLAVLQGLGQNRELLDPDYIVQQVGLDAMELYKSRNYHDWTKRFRGSILAERARLKMPFTVDEFREMMAQAKQTTPRRWKFSRRAALALRTPDGMLCWEEAAREESLRPVRNWSYSGHEEFLDWLRLAPASVRLRAITLFPGLSGKVRVPVRLPKKKIRKAKRRLSRSQRMALELSDACGGWSAGGNRYLIILAWKARTNGAKLGFALDGLYRTYTLPKRAGGTRTITVPSNVLKAFQRAVLAHLIDPLELEESVHGFRKGHSILTNALPHVGKRLVINVDIDSFFPSVRFSRVHRALRRSLEGRLSATAIRFLAEVCCFQGALPTGAPTSPGVANLVLTPIDRSLGTVCARHGIAYTRYADDLTFSGEGDTRRIIPFVRKCLAGLDLEIDQDKLNLYRRGRRQIVTGLVVNDKVSVPRRTRRRLRAAVDHASKGKDPTWHGRPMAGGQLLGRIAFLHGINPAEANALRTRLAPPEAL